MPGIVNAPWKVAFSELIYSGFGFDNSAFDGDNFDDILVMVAILMLVMRMML